VDAHLTIYIEPPVLVEGGSVIVAGRALPEEEWRRVTGGANPAAGDDANPKRQQVKEGDRLFGAVVSAPSTIVEFVYPETGSYTFNFLPAAPYRLQYENRLETEQVLVGSASNVTDPDGGFVEWSTLSVVAVLGTLRSQQFARDEAMNYADALYEPTTTTRFEGARTITLHASGSNAPEGGR